MLKLVSKISASIRSGILRMLGTGSVASESGVKSSPASTASSASLVAELQAKNEQLLATKEKLEAALQESHRAQALLDATINSTFSGVVVCDLDVGFVLINPAGRKMLGRLAESGPRNWNESLGLFPSENGVPFKGDELPLRRACGGEVITSMELFVRNGIDSEPLWLEANATQIVGLDGNPLGAVTVFNDITAQRKLREGMRDLQLQTESKLADSTRTLDEVLDTIPEAIWRGVQTEDGFTFTYFSPGIERIIGIGPDQLTDRAEIWESHVHQDDRQRIEQTVIEILAGKFDDSEFEFRLRHADGSIRWIRNRVRAVFNQQSRFVQGVMSDITEERDTKMALDRAERLVAIGTLAAGIAHEINNPLQAMLLDVETGQLYLSDEALSNERAKEIFEGIKRQITRCGRIVSGVLQFTGDTSTKRQRLSLNPIVSDAVNLIRFKAFERKIGIKSTSFGPCEPSADINDVEIGQVVVNFLANAIDASDDGATVEVIVKCEHQRVIVSVIDNGTGMDAKTKKSAFDPFYTTKRPSGGTGLGLSLSHTIVQNHGGDISIEDTSPERGTTISFWLPWLPQAKAVLPQAKAVQPQAALGSAKDTHR